VKTDIHDVLSRIKRELSPEEFASLRRIYREQYPTKSFRGALIEEINRCVEAWKDAA
jgi:hypothetical protein